MIRLHEAKMLQTLHQSLTKSLPEAMKVYGSIFHINRGNPFNLEVLVGSWPDYETVITWPQKQEMMDDKDWYTNTYYIFCKDLRKLPEILESDNVINWRQSLTIQGYQKGLNAKIRDIVASKSLQLDYSKRFLYITDNVLKSITSNTGKIMRPQEAASSENVKFRSENHNFKPCLVGVSHAELVNSNWKFERNERSLRFIRRCLQNLPGYCVLNTEGIPVCWSIMEKSSELVMSYTLPEYRNRAFARQGIIAYMDYLQKHNMSFHAHVEEMNVLVNKMAKSLGFHVIDCGWHEWICMPA